ncbi:hypothetical protein BDV59DRAFT_181611 [Aspergillus ambiguus]|uniref:uncharacterized protein n=1 Tax=Aspergillus ambiguus TaxID=176160 RepID=UPI003CCE1C62
MSHLAPVTFLGQSSSSNKLPTLVIPFNWRIITMRHTFHHTEAVCLVFLVFMFLSALAALVRGRNHSNDGPLVQSSL